MKKPQLTIILVAVTCLTVSVWHVHNFHNGLQPDLSGSGDYSFYLDCCLETPAQQHLIVPLLLQTLNIFFQSPTLTVYVVMVTGFSLTFFTTYLFTIQITGKLYSGIIAVAITLIFSCVLHAFLSVTALKNLFAVTFLLISYLLLYKLKEDWSKPKLTLFLFFAFLTALTHSLPVFLLLQTLILHSFYTAHTRRKQHVWLLSVPVLTIVALASCMWFGRMGKLAEIVHNMVFNLPATFTLNCVCAFLPYLAVFQWGLLAFVVNLTRRRKPNLFYASLLLNAGTLLFLGEKSFVHYSYSSRFHENLLPFLAVISGYITSGHWLEMKQ